MRLARGEAGSVEDIESALTLAEAAHDPQVVYPTVSFAGHVFWTVGERDRAEEMLARLADAGDTRRLGLPSGLCEVAWLASRLAVGERFLAVLADSPETPWVEAARSIAAGEPLAAAEILDRIGARPEAAYARLHSGIPAEVEKALDFYGTVGAARFVHDCQQVLAATA